HLKPRALRAGLSDCGYLVRLLEPQRDLAHEARVVAVGKPFRLRRNGSEQVAQRLHLGFPVVAEHMRRDEVLPTRSGVADADANAAEIRAERGVYRSEAIVSRGASPDFHL